MKLTDAVYTDLKKIIADKIDFTVETEKDDNGALNVQIKFILANGASVQEFRATVQDEMFDYLAGTALTPPE